MLYSFRKTISPGRANSTFRISRDANIEHVPNKLRSKFLSMFKAVLLYISKCKINLHEIFTFVGNYLEEKPFFERKIKLIWQLSGRNKLLPIKLLAINSKKKIHFWMIAEVLFLASIRWNLHVFPDQIPLREHFLWWLQFLLLWLYFTEKEIRKVIKMCYAIQRETKMKKKTKENPEKLIDNNNNNVYIVIYGPVKRSV